MAIAALILLVGEDVEFDGAFQRGLAIAKRRGELQAAGVEHERLLERAATLDLDLLGEVGQSVSGIDEIFARQKRGGWHRFAVSAEEPIAATLGRGLRGKHTPGEPRLQLRPLLGDKRPEGDGDGKLNLRRCGLGCRLGGWRRDWRRQRGDLGWWRWSDGNGLHLSDRRRRGRCFAWRRRRRFEHGVSPADSADLGAAACGASTTD